MKKLIVLTILLISANAFAGGFFPFPINTISRCSATATSTGFEGNLYNGWVNSGSPNGIDTRLPHTGTYSWYADGGYNYGGDGVLTGSICGRYLNFWVNTGASVINNLTVTVDGVLLDSSALTLGWIQKNVDMLTSGLHTVVFTAHRSNNVAPVVLDDITIY